MSGRKSKKNQKLGSSRRGNRGLRVNEEKDNEFDGPDEVHTTSPSDDTVLEAQFDHMPSLKTNNQTTALECSPRVESSINKASDVEADLPERKRKIGSTRKKAGGFKNPRNLEPCDEVRTSEEFGEEQENQLNTSTTEEEQTYQTKNEQQTQRSGSGGELGVAQNIMVTVSQSRESDAIHHQEISSYSQTSSLEAGSNMAMEQSTDQSNVVTMAKTDHETLLVSTVQKRKMGSTRRPLGGNREQNRENVEVEELYRKTTDDVWKAEVKSSEAEFSMLEEMMQTWDDVKRISPTNTSSHTESAFVLSQPLSSEITEELDASVETETNNQSVACSVVDSTKPPSDRFGNHDNLFPNKELVCSKLGLETDNHAGDFIVFQNVSDSPPTRAKNFLEEVGGFSDTYQDVPNSRHNTSEDFGSVTLVETKEEPCSSDPNIIISSSKQDTEIDKLVVNVEEPLSSPCPLDVATKYGNSEIPTDVLTAEVGRISETLESDITHAEPTKIESTPKMTDPWPDRDGLENEEKETLMEAITSGQEKKMEEEYTQSKRLEHKQENMNIQATDDFVEQEIQSDMQLGKTRKGLQKHSANETNVSDSSLGSANWNLANVSPVTERLDNVNMNLSDLMPEYSKLSGDVMVETVVSSGLNDLIINNQVLHVIVPEAENQDIYVEIKEGNDIDVIKRSITCDVTLTENVMDVENFTEQSVDPQTLATRENENVGAKTGPETDALEIKDQDNVENNAKDDMIMQILKNDRENEEDEVDTNDREKQPGSQIQGRPSRVDPDKESYDFFQDTSVENAEESLLNAKTESAFDKEGKTCEKYKTIEESGGHEKMDASAVTILDVTEHLANIPNNDIRSELQPEKHSSHINFEGLMQDAVTESSLESSAVSEQTEISIIPEDSQGVQKKDGDSEGVAEKDKGLEFQEQNNVMDQNIKQTMMVVKGDEHEITEKVRRSTQELCDDEADKAEGHAEITSEQQQRSSLNISQKQDGPPQDDSENMLESEAEEMFLRANTVHAAFERMIKTNNERKEIEEAAEHLTNVNIQDNANQSDLQTENPEQNKVLTAGQINTSPHINLEELKESEHVKNVNDVTDSSLSFEGSGESHKELANINEIPEDSQKGEKQSKIKPLLHKRKMKGNKRQRRDREQDDDSETLNNEEKELEKEISGGKDTGPVEELNSTIIQSSFNAEKSTEESICDITESQTTTTFYAGSQENAGDVESLPPEGDTDAHLEIQTDIKMFDSTIVEGTKENICDDDVLMRHVEFVGDTVRVESNMTIESDLLQNNTSLDTHQEAFKSSENVESVSAVTDSGLLLKDVVLVGSGETEAVSEEPEISNISENSQRDSSPTLNLLAHKRKMGSTRRPLRGNKGQRKDREQDDENETLNSKSLFNEEKSTEETICDITESQTTTKCQAESQENAGDVESLPTGGDTEAYLEIRTDVKMFDSTIIEEGTEENICDDNVLMRHVEFVGDTFTVETNMTIESDFVQNNTSLDTNQEALKSFETAQNNSAVTDTALPLKDVVLVGSGKKTEMSIISDNSQGDSSSKLNPLAHKRKMGSTRRPLRGNKEKIKNAEEKEDGGSEGVAEEDTDKHSETQEQNNVINDNIIKTVDISDNEELERTETVRKSTQELCDDAVDKVDGHAEITSQQQLRSSSNVCQTQDGSPQDESENMLESEMDVREEKDEETDNKLNNIETTMSEEIFTLKDINSEVTVTPHTQNQLFIQTADEDVHDYIQTVKDEHEESGVDEMFLCTNTDAAFDSRNETQDDSKETEDLKEITNLIIQDTDSQLDLETENTKQNKVLTEEQNTNTTLLINVVERQETEHAENVFAVTDSGLSFGDSEESHKELENINDIPEDSQKEEKQSKIKPLLHKRKMKGNKRQRKDREQDDDSETLNNEEKELEKEISGGKDTGPVEKLDSTIIQSSCNAEKSTEESICDITESQTTRKFQAESQENAGDVESLPTGGDTEANLEIQTDFKMFDSTIVEGTEENICDDNVLMRQVVFVGDTLTVESNMTIESDLLQNNTSLDTNKEALKSSENVESVSAVTDASLLLKDVVLVGSGETEAVSEEPEFRITSENSQRDSSPTLNLLAHKRKMGSTRRPLRGNQGQRKDREQDDENETLNSKSLITEEKSTEETICDITESQTTTKCQAESQETAGDVESLPTGRDTEAHLEIRTDVKMFDSSIIEEGTEENICDDNVLMRHVEFVGDTFTVETNMTIESDFVQNNTSLDTNQEALKSFETAQNNSAVTDTALPLKDVVLVGSGEKTEMSIISDNSQGDSPSKLNPLAHKRKMGSTRRPLRGNKEKRKNAEEKEDGGSEGVAEEDTDKHSETQEQNNVINDNIIKTVDVSDNEELERTETVRKSTQELCDDAVDKVDGHAEITSQQQLRSSSNICQTQDGSPQDESENMLESEMDVREEKDEETDNTLNNIETTMSEEIFTLKDINSEVTVTPHTQNQLFIQTADEDVHDYIQTVKDEHEESGVDEMFLCTNTDAAFDSRNETQDDSKETEDLKEITNLIIQDTDSQLDLETENTKQNKVLTEEQNTNTTLLINVVERQETEHAENVFAVTDSGLSFGDSEETHKERENINDIPEDSQKEEKQSKIKPLLHKRKMKGNKRQRKDREQDDDSETLNNEEKELEKEISGGKDTGPVEELDSTIIKSSCNAVKSTEETICDITESQTTRKFQAESQENAGDVESLPTGGDTDAHLEIQTDFKMFDSTIVEGTEENICDDNVLMRQVVFVGDTLTVESNMTIESDLLQNNTSLDTNKEALKSSENIESVSAVTDASLLLKDVVSVGSGETEAVSEEPEFRITSENSQRDSSPTLNLLAHKRKMGSTRRPLRGNQGQRKDREQDDENKTLNSKSLIIEEKSTEETICDITESQTTTKCYAESQETAGDVASIPTGGDTDAHLEIQTDIKMFDSTIFDEGTEENICDDNVLMRHVEFVGDTFTVETNMTIESDFVQNNTSLDTNQAQNNSAVTDTALPQKDVVLVGSGEKTEMSIISDNSQGDSPSKLNPLAHKRKMGSTRRPLRGNKEKIKNAEERKDGGSEGVAEEDTDKHSETQEQNNVINDNIIKTVDISDNEELERTETVRKSTQELCDDAVDKVDGHAEITSQQQLRSSSNVCQTQDGSKQDDSENILKSEMDVREEKETENNDEEIFSFEDISSDVTVPPQAQNQLFIHTTDANSHDFIQTVKDEHEESQGKEMFLSESANLTIQDNDSQSDLQTEKSKQNKVLTEDQNTNPTPHINLEDSQETERNVFAVTDSGLSFGDSGESHKELKNINDIPEDTQKVQSKLNPLVHKRKMGSTRRPPGGNKGQRKDRQWHAEFLKNSGDLEFQTDIKTFDSTVEEGKKDNICNDDVFMTQAEFVGYKSTVECNMTIESDFLLNNTSLDTNQEAVKSSESTVIQSGLVLQDGATESLLESNTVPAKTEISIIPEDSHVEDSHSKLNPVVQKRKMGSTRRPLRGNKGKDDLREAKEEDMEPHSKIQEQNDVTDHDTMQKIMDVRHNKEKNSILRLPIQELCERLSESKEWRSDITLEQEQTASSNISQTQTAPSQDDACENLPEIQESNNLVLSEALVMEENQIHVSEPVVMVGGPQIEDGKIQSEFSRSVQKRKMGSTRKTQRGQRMEKERELGEELDFQTKNASTTEDTIKQQDNFILEEVMSLTVPGTHAQQQPSSLPSNKEGHDIENNGSKMNNQTEKPEQTEIQMQTYPNSNTNPHQNQDKSETLISEKSHSENIQSNMNPTAQKRKMGSTRKTQRGNGRRTREVESKEIDGDSERTSEEHSTEFATIERAPETKLDENTQLNETRSTESLIHPVATSKISFKTEDGVKKFSTNIVGLSVASEEIRSNEAPSEAFCRDIQSEMLVSADEMKAGEKYDGPSGLENLDKSKSLEEVESKPQLQLTELDQSHQMHSEKDPRSENVTTERKRKMGSTRKNLRGKREEKKREEPGSNQFVPEEDQDGETSIIREAEPDQLIHNSFEESDSSLLSEIERALRKTSPSSRNTDYQLIVNEPNLAKTPETSHFKTPENSEPEQGSDKEKYVSLQVTESQNQSEIGSPRRRRKMGSTRKNPRQELQANREDENEEDESEEKNKQESKSLKKDLEAAEESKMHDSRDNAENKEYLDVPVALTSSCQTEESTNPAGQEGTSPQTKRKFGSRRTNVGKRDFCGLIPPESNDDLTEDTGARLVSLDQMIKLSQHDGQTAGLKNNMEVVQFNVVMVGNSSVGKTSFVRRFHGGEFSSDFSATIGVDTCIQKIVFHDRVVKLQIWDTAGQERFHSITTQVFHKADGLLLMYEVTSSTSFISVRDWISQIQEKAPEDVIVMLLGNKNDCTGREVQVQEGEDLAREYKISFMECSAATGVNVSECMKSLAEMLMQRKRQKMEDHTALKREKPQKKSGCC